MFRRRLAPPALVLLLAGAHAASGQGGPAPGDSRLDPEPLVAEALGLRINLPRGTVATTEMSGGRLVYTFADRPVGATWTMRLNELVTTLADPKPSRLADEKVRSFEDGRNPFRVLVNQDLDCGGVAGRLLYIWQKASDGAEAVNGWLILPRSGPSFLVFSIVTTADRIDSVRPILDASLATVRVRAPAEQKALHEQRLQLGREAVDTFTEERLREAAGPRQWYRISVPGEAGRPDTEVGYLSLEAREAARGEVEPDRDPSRYGALEAQSGLMVLLEGRVIIGEPRNGHFYDIQGRYWLAWDRAVEQWSVRMTQRQGEATKSTSETGLRELGKLRVIAASLEEYTRDPVSWTISEKAYLSQVEVFLLGALLPRDGSITGEMSFLYYEPTMRMLPLRLDLWGPGGGGTARWSLRTRPFLQALTIDQDFDASGRRLRRVDWDGQVRKVTEPIDPEALRRLWEEKGLSRR